MDEKDNKELNLEDIMREFGAAPAEEPATQPAEEVQEEAPVAEEVQEEEVETSEDLDDELLSIWLTDKKTPEQTQSAEPESENLEQTRRIELEPENLEQTRRIELEPENLEQTRRMEPVTGADPQSEVTGDTIRLDGLTDGLSFKVSRGHAAEDTQRIWTPGEKAQSQTEGWQQGDTIHSEPFSKNWEPEYEQPMGEYVPPQPIQFNPRSRFQELKKKLIEGPERRYYQLMEKGVGKEQAAIFFSLLVVLVCAASTAMYAMGMVQDNRMRLMVFIQFIAMLISAFIGSNQLIDGVLDITKKRFTLNTLLVITFVVCCVDGGLCLHQVRVPCCAAFSLEMTMSLWSAYQRKTIEMSQMDTLRKATRLDGVAACPDYMEGKIGLLRKQGELEDFMDIYDQQAKPERTLHIYSLIATVIAFGIGIFAGVKGGFSAGVQVAAVSLLAAVPATAFITHSRPTILLERRLHKLGTVICGWKSVEMLSKKAVFPLTFGDLYPSDGVRLNGVKYFGSRQPEDVAAYATAVVVASGCGLAGLFHQVLDSHNGRHYDATDIANYESGGMSGIVNGESVLIGSVSFLKEMDVEVPENARISYGVYVAIDGELSGLYAVSYDKIRSAAAGLTTLTAYRGLQCAVVSDDFMLTPGFMRSKFGVKNKRLLLPEYELRAELREKTLEPDAPTLLMTTALGLAPLAFAVTGARALRTTCRMGTVLHIVGGAIGLAIMLLLTVLGALEVLTPANMFLYQLVWMIPALLFTEWTRSV